ncbi:TFIIH p62 subunit, N-terminal domain-containing protein [Dioszegia hungarica]|uniref:TFIIH p62 subunit, N-terminal domain-containing protein n=1 Tax=Dioszegia hungarica TaxID=4972 RepID=A0AA38LY05_9TREE|nr:TFIIH p62 subunit, N-terminal domain-containing protein [Dioszegia hungarica]KAI9639283.1 TFIIH p62 subunit, N-terminal domain-containing protein [Dioszegia hungarica]
MTDPQAVRRYDADFKSTPGMLSITASHIAWNPSTANAMDRQQQNMNRVTNMLASKAGKPKISLKLVFKDDVPAGGLLFTFTAASKEEDRKAVQDILIPFVSANKGIPVGAAPTPVAGPSGPTTATAALVSGAAGSSGAPSPGTPVGTPSAVSKGKRKAEDTLMTPAKKAETKLKMRVLNKNSNLKALHRELVMGGQISEKEFWEGREALIQAEGLAQSLKPGRPSRLLDDRFDLDASRNKSSGSGTGVGVKQNKETGPMILNITKDLTREIFEEFPVVQDAYARYVPGISEAEFWTRYFTSRLWEQHRASVRKSTNEEVNKKNDDIFDRYLEEPDWNQAPRRDAAAPVVRFLDLAATEEDHGDSDTVRDHTMQAGRERSSLPLIRRFNEHSNKLLRRGNDGRAQNGGADGDEADELDIYGEIDLEDLHGPAAPQTIALDVQGGDMVAERREGAVAKGIMPGRRNLELVDIASDQALHIRLWNADLSGVSLPNPISPQDREMGLSSEQQEAEKRFAAQRDGVQGAMMAVKGLHRASNAETAIKDPLPQNILDAMRSCHNAATEFLRQYWSAVLPTPSAALGAGTAATSDATKAAKADKMAGYLRLTEGKVEAVVQTAQVAGVDVGRVKAALAPTMGAVNVALERESRRTGTVI